MAYSVLEQCFNTQFPIPSGPVALCTLNWVNKRLTSSSVVSILSIRAFVSDWKLGRRGKGISWSSEAIEAK